MVKKAGKVKKINNISIAKIARSTGAPYDMGSGIVLHRKIGEHYKRGESLATINAENKEKFKYGLERLKQNPIFG